MDCLTQLVSRLAHVGASKPTDARQLNLIMFMAQDPDEDVQEAAETLQHNIYYNGEALDIALEGLRAYKDQSIA